MALVSRTAVSVVTTCVCQCSATRVRQTTIRSSVRISGGRNIIYRKNTKYSSKNCGNFCLAIGNTGLISVIWYFDISKEIRLCKKDRKTMQFSSWNISSLSHFLSLFHSHTHTHTHTHTCLYMYISHLNMSLFDSNLVAIHCVLSFNYFLACKHFVEGFVGVRNIILCVLPWKKFGKSWSMQWQMTDEENINV